MTNPQRYPRHHQWIDAATGLGVVIAGTLLVFLVPDAMLAAWSVPLGIALGALVAPRSGVLLRLVGLLIGGYCANGAYASLRRLDGTERTYLIALSAAIMAAGVFYMIRKQRRWPPPPVAARPSP